MKKKTYKAMLNRTGRLIKQAILKSEEERKDEHLKRVQAETERDRYKERFRRFGTNVVTIEPDNGKALRMVKWEINPETYGNYMTLMEPDLLMQSEIQRRIQEELVRSIVKGLMEANMVQFISKGRNEFDPIQRFCTVAAKLYVVPWEQVPHKRRIELMQYAEKCWRDDDEEVGRDPEVADPAG